MPAYVIAGINVTDPDDYINYASQTVESAEKAGGRFLVKGGEQHILEGAVPGRDTDMPAVAHPIATAAAGD